MSHDEPAEVPVVTQPSGSSTNSDGEASGIGEFPIRIEVVVSTRHDQHRSPPWITSLTQAYLEGPSEPCGAIGHDLLFDDVEESGPLDEWNLHPKGG